MAGKRHSVSKVDLLPEPIRQTVGRLIACNHTIDDIVSHLRQMEAAGENFDMPSRSGIGRYAERIRALQRYGNESAAILGAIAPSFGEKPDDKLGRMAGELVKAGIFKMLSAVEIDEETGEASIVSLDGKTAVAFAGALRDLAQRDKIDADRTLRMKEEFAKEAAKAVAAVVREDGISADIAQRLSDAVMGVGVNK